jgi:hypothetical protein
VTTIINNINIINSHTIVTIIIFVNVTFSALSLSLLDHQHPIKYVVASTTVAATTTTAAVAAAAITPIRTTSSIFDEDAREVDAIIQQHEQILINNHTNNESNNIITSNTKLSTTPTITSKWTSSRQPSRMASPALSTSSQSSGRIITFLNHEVIQLPAYLEREIRVKYNFDQLGE